MTDLKRRKTLKILTTSAAAVSAMAAGILPLTAVSAPADAGMSIEVQYSASGATDALVLHNPSAENLSVAMNFSGDIAVPGGTLDVSQLMRSGPVSLQAGETRYLHLARLEQDAGTPWSATASATTGSHQALRFPVSDNVYLDSISVMTDGNDVRKIPMLLKRTV